MKIFSEAEEATISGKHRCPVEGEVNTSQNESSTKHFQEASGLSLQAAIARMDLEAAIFIFHTSARMVDRRNQFRRMDQFGPMGITALSVIR
jgi:hypothetical protein